MPPSIEPPPSGRLAASAEVFLAFLRLGLTSFGGPIAHLGYFREAFVVRRRWLDEASYGDLVALCQFLPGPASSQVGFAIGLMRAGLPGGLAAWAGFTLPSAIAMTGLAFAAAASTSTLGMGIIHGLKIVAVAVVAQAVLGMARALCPDRTTATIAICGAVLALLLSGSPGQILAIVLGAVAGLVLCRGTDTAAAAALPVPVSRGVGLACLIAFAVLLVGLPALAPLTGSHGAALFEATYRSGALVFGGGHVVLPLLEAETVETGWVARDAFLAGYGAAQAMPGPLFTIAAYLGAAGGPAHNGIVGAAIALVGIFLPGLLLLTGALPFWDRFRNLSAGQALMSGANAAVVGILGAALYDPLWTSAILGPLDAALALAAFGLLTIWKAPPVLVVALTVTGGIAVAML